MEAAFAVFIILIASLWLAAAASSIWILVASLMLMREFKCPKDMYSRKTLWNPMNVLLLPHLLTERGLRIRESIGRACMVYVAAMLVFGAFAVLVKVTEK